MVKLEKERNYSMKKIQDFITNTSVTIKSKFRYATLNFLFILTFITVIQNIFGANNSIVAVIFIQIMLSTMHRDRTATPIKHFFIQTLVLMLMGVGSCIAVNLPPQFALFIHFIIMFILLYSYTFEYLDDLYFPYILSYIFFVCLAPIAFEQLPLRLLLILVGSISIILYQWIMGHTRIQKTSKNVLLTIIDETNDHINDIINHQPLKEEYQSLRSHLYRLSKLIYDRRKKALCISDAAFATLDVGRGLEALTIQLSQVNKESLLVKKELFYQITFYLSCFKSYILQETDCLPAIDFSFLPLENKEIAIINTTLCYIRKSLLNINMKDKKDTYQKTISSYAYRLQSLLHVSQVRVLYALRVSLLLSISLFFIRYFNLEHGRWLLFTIASISLPYVDDIRPKAKKRILATLIGCTIGVVCFGFISDITLRTIILTLSGYITFYLTDYATTFTCSTIGALGGAMLSKVFGITAVANVVGIRIFYILMGIFIVYITNIYIFPFYREKATRQLAKKYIKTSTLLSQVCQEEDIDLQLYYHLIIQIFLQEETLRRNASILKWDTVNDFLEAIQKNIRLAYPKYKDMPS